MKDKIICLVGPSGSGKTTIAKELEKEGYNIIHSYTDRKPRVENEWGHTFVSVEEMSKSHKSMIYGDIMLDDSVNNLTTSRCVLPVCFGNGKWNQEWQGARVDDWQSFYQLVQGGRYEV